MARFYGDKEDIDRSKVKDFFNKRAENESLDNFTMVLFQGEEGSKIRHEEESKVFLENIDIKGKKILEIGCGAGRFSEIVHKECESYLGLDFSTNLIKIANETYNYENCFYQVMSATDIRINELLVDAPFDVIVFSGVLMYLNDEDIQTVLEQINNVLSSEGLIYVGEPISVMDTRLTLKDFYSEGLEDDYNSIYRTEKEYLNYFLKLDNIQLIHKQRMFEKRNTRTEETSFEAFIFKSHINN